MPGWPGPPSGKRKGLLQCLAGSGPPRLSGTAAAASTGRAVRRRATMLPLLLLLLLLLHCRRGAHGESSLGGPVRVRFLAETFHHVLHWEPGPDDAPEARYDVQYKRYGHPGWIPVSHCAATASRSCDLTPQTLSPQQRYYARVRTVIGNRTSHWTLTSSPFNPKEATLRLASVSLTVTSNTIHVTLQLPVNRWGNITCEDIYGQRLQYHVCVRRTSNGRQSMYVGTSLEFDLPPLLWGERYCVSVEARKASQPNPGKRTEEKCLSIPSADDQARTIVLPSFTLLSLVVLGILGTAWAWMYVKKPTKTPPVLKFLLQSGSPWGPKRLPALGMKDVVLCVEADSVQQLSLSPKHCTEPNGLNLRSAGAAESCWLPAPWAGDESKSLGLQDREDSSGCSMDSGICLQEGSGSLSHFLDCWRPSLGSSKMGEGVQEGNSGFCGKTGHVFQSRKRKELALEAEGNQDHPQALLSGYQKQSGSSKTVPITDKMVHSQPGMASGYLKQSSFAFPSDLGDMTPTQDIPCRTLQFAATSPHVLWPLDLSPECPKTPLPGFFLEPPASPHPQGR